MKKSITSITTLSILALTVSGCVLETVTIKPDSKRFYLPTSKSGHATMPESPIGIPCPGACFATMGTGCTVQLPADDSTIVGFSHNYDHGTEPCRCWEYANCAYRGYVGFNLSALQGKGIGSANLKWDSSTQKSYGDTASNEGTCVAKVFIALEPWQQNITTQGEDLNVDWPTGNINVSSTVRDWMSGARPNYGFFFVGPDENLNVKNNDKCLTIMENLRLEVLVSEKK
ncbi:MAG: hypothetical protein ACYDIB_14265 [Desulfobulbia bacterium]